MWGERVEVYGIAEVRKRAAFHDEPLKGKRKGQRSIRLSKAYRAIYIESETDIIVVLEANKHDY